MNECQKTNNIFEKSVTYRPGIERYTEEVNRDPTAAAAFGLPGARTDTAGISMTTSAAVAAPFRADTAYSSAARHAVPTTATPSSSSSPTAAKAITTATATPAAAAVTATIARAGARAATGAPAPCPSTVTTWKIWV